METQEDSQEVGHGVSGVESSVNVSSIQLTSKYMFGD